MQDSSYFNFVYGKLSRFIWLNSARSAFYAHNRYFLSALNMVNNFKIEYIHKILFFVQNRRRSCSS